MKSEFRNWSDVRVFLAVFREGSTLAASRKLGVAQPTVARRIEVLENETGLILFERDTRGFKPTSDARRLYPLAEALEETAKGFGDIAKNLSKPRPIRITAPSSFADPGMEMFSEFSAARPDVAIEFVHSIKLLNLVDGEADVALRVSSDEPDGSLICRKIGTEHFALYAGQSYADKHGVPTSVDEFRGHRFVTFVHDGAPDVLNGWLVRQVKPSQIVRSFGEIDLMYAAIKAGLGLGLVHARWGDREHALLRCFENIEELARPVRMLIAPDAYRRPEVRAFSKFFAPRYASWFNS